MEFNISPAKGDAKTVFEFRGSGYEPGKVLSIDFGDGASTTVTVSDDGHWHVNYKFNESGDYDVKTHYLGENNKIDSETVVVS